MQREQSFEGGARVGWQGSARRECSDSGLYWDGAYPLCMAMRLRATAYSTEYLVAKRSGCPEVGVGGHTCMAVCAPLVPSMSHFCEGVCWRLRPGLRSAMCCPEGGVKS